MITGGQPVSRIDSVIARTLATPLRERLWRWGGPLVVLLTAALLRLWDLGHPRALVFDETYYVKDAYSLTRFGYEGSWPKNANAAFEQGVTTGLSADPSFVVHPPLGKWLISLGIQWFGVENPAGWRITTAIAGIVAVGLLMFVAQRLMQSTLLSVIAGLLFAVDGNAVVMSRVAILDNWVMLFALIGAAAVLTDRSRHEQRLRHALAWSRSGGQSPRWGAVIWWRPWLILAGLAFGATAAVKWSGFWFVAAFGLYVVAVDVLARRRLRLARALPAGIFAQGPVAFVSLVPPAVLVYAASWIGWLVTSGGWDRDWAVRNAYAGPFPNWLASLGYYHFQAYNYHVGLSTPHPYQANPLTWLFMIRPTSMYYEGATFGENGCGVDACSSAITGIGNPLIWWAAAVAALYLYYRLIMRREWQVGFVLLGLAAGYLPWMFYLGRTVFQFYSIAFEPFLILGLTWCIGLILGSRGDDPGRRERGITIVAVYLVLVIAVSAYFVPLMTGMQVPFGFWNAHMWLPSWR